MTWYEDFYAGVDAMDPTIVDQFCSPDTTVRFANHPAAVGPEAVRESPEYLWSTIAGLRHQIIEVIEDGDRAVVEAVVEYTRHDQTVVSIPVATAIRRRDGLIVSQRIYIDMTPLAS